MYNKNPEHESGPKKTFGNGSVAHLGERLICIQEVESSILFRSTSKPIPPEYKSQATCRE